MGGQKLFLLANVLHRSFNTEETEGLFGIYTEASIDFTSNELGKFCDGASPALADRGGMLPNVG